MHPNESKRNVHQTPIPVDGYEVAYEYTFPVLDVPTELDYEWRTWFEPLVGLNADGIYDSIRRRFEKVGTQFTILRDQVLEYTPFSILIYGGTPLFWLRRPQVADHDFIYLPPESTRKEVLKQLEPYELDSPEPCADLLANFGGAGERWPWESFEFSGQKAKGRTIISESNRHITEGLEYCTEAEKQLRLHNMKRWLGGVTVLIGGDDMYWHLGKDGTVCIYTGASDDVDDVHDSLADMVAELFTGNPKKPLFAGCY